LRIFGEYRLKEDPVTESIEDYLEALWMANERGQDLARIKWIAAHLRIAPPSVVEMLRKLRKENYVVYIPRKGARLTDKGRTIAKAIIRNHRLMEVLMKKTLRIKLDHQSVCGIEHHMNEDFADAICTLLKHPRKCPHGYPIPKGECCPARLG